MKLTVQTFLNHVSEEDFDRSLQEIKDARRRYLETRQPPPAPAEAAHAAASDNLNAAWSPMEYHRHPQQNLQRNSVSTTVATVPILLNDVIFEDGVIDTGATNTMVSQTTARQLGLLDEIEPCRVKFTCADGKSAVPWGVLRRLNVGVEGLTFPLDVYVSGAHSYDVLLGTDWLTQAQAEISFATSEMSFRIDPNVIGKIPIKVSPNRSGVVRYCAFAEPALEYPPLAEESSGSTEEEPHDDDNSTTTESVTISTSSTTSTDQDDIDFQSYEDLPALVEISAMENAAPFASTDGPSHEGTSGGEPPPETNNLMLNKGIFRELEEEMGPFDVDACCTNDGGNALVQNYWCPMRDCLTQSWEHKNVYCMPPPLKQRQRWSW